MSCLMLGSVALDLLVHSSSTEYGLKERSWPLDWRRDLLSLSGELWRGCVLTSVSETELALPLV